MYIYILCARLRVEVESILSLAWFLVNRNISSTTPFVKTKKSTFKQLLNPVNRWHQKKKWILFSCISKGSKALNQNYY